MSAGGEAAARSAMNEADGPQRVDGRRTVLHWYDFLCPFCYVGLHRNAILVHHGLHLIQLPFQPHADIPEEGIPAPVRAGPMYTMLEREAGEAGLPLHWPPRLPNTRRALAAAEWTRRHEPHAFPELHAALFKAHFVFGEDLGDVSVIDRYASESGLDLGRLHAAFADGTAFGAVAEAELMGRRYGVHGTPAWWLNGRLIEGLVSAVEFERVVEAVA
jgi:predicted DsbA family dithiol-disulfide isomerase